LELFDLRKLLKDTALWDESLVVQGKQEFYLVTKVISMTVKIPVKCERHMFKRVMLQCELLLKKKIVVLLSIPLSYSCNI